jgi:hypothetical protein
MLLSFIYWWNLTGDTIHVFNQAGSLKVISPFRGSGKQDTPDSVHHTYTTEVDDLTQWIGRKSFYQILGIYTKTKP